MDFEREPKEDVKINRYRLDEECEKQSTLYLYYSDLLADAKVEKDLLEDEMDLLLASTELEYRETPPDNIKITESVIKALLDNNNCVIQSKLRLRKAKEDFYKIEVVVKSLEHRKSQLDNLVVLWSKGYYSQPDGGKYFNGNDEYQRDYRKSLNREKEE